MTELSDRLYILADEATRGVELLPPRLALRARQRRRRLVIGAVTVTAAAVVLVALTTLVPLRHHTTRVATLSSPTTTPVPGTVTPPLPQLSSLALTQAARAGDPAPHSGMVVATTRQAAKRLLDDSNNELKDPTPVYLVVLSGQFQCGSSCFGVSSPSPSGSTMTLILGRQDLRVQGFGLSDRVIDLTPLGAVYRLDLTRTIVVPDVVSMPVAAATNALASVGLKVSVHQQQSTVMPLGVIISQQQPGSTLLPPGATVTRR
jgi:hypothetical protein